MCDLIDLNSPDPRKLKAISKLASPLIPGPQTPVEKPEIIVEFVSHGKRSSLENNPFDKVFKESAEYAAKRDDPFESVMQKAQQQDDLTPKRKRHSDILKMNKTMDEPLLHGILNKNFYLSRQNGVQDSNDAIENKGKISPRIIICPPSPGNCSVLNQSAMNDSLLEAETEEAEKNYDVGHSGFGNESRTATERIGEIRIESVSLEPLKHGRSLSQGNRNLPEIEQREIDNLPRPRSKSIVENLRVSSSLKNKSRVSSASSAFSGNSDFADNAFIETGSVTGSESFDLSRISATPRQSFGSYGSVGSLNSCSSKNRAFILDSQSSKLAGSSSSVKSSLNLSSISRSAGNFLIKTPLKTPVRIADLELRFEKLKLQSNGSIGGLPLYSPNRKVKSFLKSDRTESENASQDARLIDTEGYECNVENTDSAANYSSDSVFIENCNVDQSVFREAKLLARTFDELAHQSNSNSFSSGDDLLYSRPRWNFDILPVSDDDEAVVDNLIELPVSPMKHEAEIGSSENKDVEETENGKLAGSKVCDKIKELETQFIDQDVGRNKVMAATLLLDLEKIVHRENNPEAITLLENLEKVLGVKYESNAQLLATCMQGTNNLSKSPKKYPNKLGSNENIKLESLEKSDEDNNDTGLSDGEKNSKILNDESLETNFNLPTSMEKSEKSIIANLSSPVEEKKENFVEKSNNIGKVTSVDQTEALELITNLSKILGGPNNDSSPISLLTNLRQVLNLATNQLNFENAQIVKSQSQESPSEVDFSHEKPLGKPKLDGVKTGRKRSADSSPKIQSAVQSGTKRSMSFSGGQRSVVLTSVSSKEKAKPHSRSFKKAFSCEAVPKPDKLEKPSAVVPETVRARASTIGGTAKYKLKKKSESDSVTGKKGPLKALLPVGNMQRRGSMSTKVAPISLSRTPPKSSSTVASTFTSAMSSTPNPSVAIVASRQSPKTKPVASSTPDAGGSKARKIRLQFSKNNSKPKFSCNISPVTPLPTHSITGAVTSKGSSKIHRHNKTLSPPKSRSSGEVSALNTTESSIPKYSPLAGFSRRNSKETIKTLENSVSPKTSSSKSHTPKKSPFVNRKSESQIPQSPLKTVNNQNSKFKPFNLISKLRRGSNGSTASDKENCA